MDERVGSVLGLRCPLELFTRDSDFERFKEYGLKVKVLDR